MDDEESGRDNEILHPVFRTRDRKPIRHTGDFSDLPLRAIRTSKPTLKTATSHYTGETLKSYTPSTRTREGQEQQEVTLGFDQGIPRTPTPASRSVTSRPRLRVDAIPEEHGTSGNTAGTAVSLQPSPTAVLGVDGTFPVLGTSS
ncbi:hypothetical protein LTR93_011588 [Exophiala xenobiotica]|nr:hypothetical protein LTR93_011588 [Exophiala xenobiotica]